MSACGLLLITSLANSPQLALVAPALAQPAVDATAGAYSLTARGPQALRTNPATLAWTHGHEVRLGATGSLQNNTFSLSDYNRWNGAIWSEEDKTEILSKIEDNQLDGHYRGSAASPGVAWDNWAFAVDTRSAGDITMPREYVDLLFTGNEPGRSWTFEGSGGTQYSYTSIALGTGVSLVGQTLAGGLVARYLRGWEYRDVIRVRGDLSTTLQSVVGSLEATTRTAEGGNGFAADLGLAARIDGAAIPWELGLTLRNVVGFIDWSNEPKLHIDRAVADSLTLNDLEDEDFVDLSSDAPLERAFRQTLARELELGVATTYQDARIEVNYRQGFENTPETSTDPRLAIGAEYPAFPWGIGRAGIAVGGVDGPLLAAGAGLRFGSIVVDISYQSLGSLHVFLPRGIGAGLSVSYHWQSEDARTH